MPNLTLTTPLDTCLATATAAEALAFLGGTPAAHLVWCGPASGSAAAPDFRALVAGDIPDLSAVYSPLAGSSSIVTVGTLTGGSTGAGFTIALDVATVTGSLPLAQVSGTTAIGTSFVTLPNPLSDITFPRVNLDRSVDLLSDADFRTAIGVTTPTTVGNAFFTLSNPSAITFARVNADNSVTLLNAADFKTALSITTFDPAALTNVIAAAEIHLGTGDVTTIKRADGYTMLTISDAGLRVNFACGIAFNGNQFVDLTQPTVKMPEVTSGDTVGVTPPATFVKFTAGSTAYAIPCYAIA